jgi:hypothetical protein
MDYEWRPTAAEFIERLRPMQEACDTVWQELDLDNHPRVRLAMLPRWHPKRLWYAFQQLMSG